MIMRVVTLLGIFLSSPLVWSFPCYYTLAKDSCWLNYDVSVVILDLAQPEGSQQIATVDVPAGTPWTRVSFSCTPVQNLRYIAQFSPVFWASDKGKTYRALRDWTLPAKVNPGDLAWTIPVCFSADFAQVPLPPDAKGNCACDFSKIPAPKVP